MTLTSKLDAVNTILGAAGESLVVSLDGTTADAANAETVLNEVIRSVQTEGWHFNTEDNVKFTPNSDGEIVLPENILKFDVDPLRYYDIDVVQRGQKLYDKKNHTHTFTRAIEAEVIYLLEFEELPEAARSYITIRAARVFVDRFIGSETKRGFTSEDEARARVLIVGDQLDNADTNLFRDNPQTAWGLSRR